MPERGHAINDPALAKAFAEGFVEGMQEIYSGEEPEWEVTISYEGTTLNQYRTTSLDVLLGHVGGSGVGEIEKALTNGCAIKIEPVTNDNRPEPAAVTAAKDDDVVDAEIVD